MYYYTILLLLRSNFSWLSYIMHALIDTFNQLLHAQPHYNHFYKHYDIMICNVDQTISTCKPFKWFSNYISLGVEEIVIRVRSCQEVSQR